MIDVKLIAKSKDTNTTSGINTSTRPSGTAATNAIHADKADVAVESEHAASASISDLANKALNLSQGSSDWSTITAQITNALKALSSVYLSKVNADTAAEVITFAKGLLLGTGDYGLTSDGVAHLVRVALGAYSFNEWGQLISSSIHNTGDIASSSIHNTGDIASGSIHNSGDITTSGVLSPNFTTGMSGTGYAIKNENGASSLEIDKLTVRLKAIFNELEIRKLSYVGGNLLISGAGSKITKVESVTDSGGVVTGYKCYYLADDGTTATANNWQVGDLARCETWGMKTTGTFADATNGNYWRMVTGSGNGYIVLGNSTGQYMDDSTAPHDGDTIALMGHTLQGISDTATERQNFILITTSDTDSPAIKMYTGVEGFTLDGKLCSTISPTGVKFATKFLKIEDWDGSAYHVPVDRGEWTSTDKYNYYNRVSHNGSLWILDKITEGSSVTGEEPTEASAHWTKQVSKGGNGNGISSVTRMYITSTAAPGSGNEPTDSTTYVWASYADAIAGGAGSNGHAWDATWKYLYCSEVTVYTDGTRNVVISLSSIFVVNGNDGDDGKSAPYLVLTMDGEQRDTVTLSTADNGLVSGTLTNGNAYVTLASRITIGYTIVNGTLKSGSSPEYVGTNCRLTTTAITKLATQSITYTDASNNTQTAYINVTEATVIISVPLADGTTITGTYHIKVDVSRYTGGIYWDNKTFRTGYESWKTDVDGTLTDYQSSISDNADSISAEVTSRENADSVLTTSMRTLDTKITQTAEAISTEVSRATTAEGTLDSKITQTAEAISLKVETAGGRKNLIAGTAFRRQEEFAWNGRSVDCNIVCNAYVGTNAIYVNSTTTAVSSGVAFNNISCKSSTSYRLTVLTKTPALSSFTCSTSYAVAVVRLYNSTGAMTQQIPCSIKPDANDTWKTNKTIFTTASDTVSLSVLLYVSNDGKLYICRPMLEESSTPDSGWTLSVNDYSYVGGNMLAGSRTLDSGMEKDGVVTVAGYGDKAVIYKDNSSGTTWSNVLQYTLTGAIEGNMDYMLSLWVKGSGKVQLYLYNGSVTKQIEGSEGWSDTATDGNCDVVLTSEWKRIWVHWRTLQTINSTVSVLARCPAGSKLFVAGMKLEKGAMVTEYSESSEDLVSKTALLACGIDITSHKILATTDNFVIQNQSGETTMTVDEDGNLATSGGAAFKGTVKATVFYNNVLTIGYGIGGTWTNGNMSVENADILIFRYANWDNYPAYNITIPTATSVAGKILEIYNYAKKSDNVTRPVINLRTVDLKDGDFFNPASSSTDILNIQGCKSLRLISSPTNADGSVYEWLMVDMVNAD